MSETITNAAIQHGGITYSLDRPGRHGDILKLMAGVRVDRLPIQPEEQGFLTSEGRFVDRKEAMRIAFDAGQIEEQKSELFTEDLW